MIRHAVANEQVVGAFHVQPGLVHCGIRLAIGCSGQRTAVVPSRTDGDVVDHGVEHLVAVFDIKTGASDIIKKHLLRRAHGGWNEGSVRADGKIPPHYSGIYNWTLLPSRRQNNPTYDESEGSICLQRPRCPHFSTLTFATSEKPACAEAVCRPMVQELRLFVHIHPLSGCSEAGPGFIQARITGDLFKIITGNNYVSTEVDDFC